MEDPIDIAEEQTFFIPCKRPLLCVPWVRFSLGFFVTLFVGAGIGEAFAPAPPHVFATVMFASAGVVGVVACLLRSKWRCAVVANSTQALILWSSGKPREVPAHTIRLIAGRRVLFVDLEKKGDLIVPGRISLIHDSGRETLKFDGRERPYPGLAAFAALCEALPWVCSVDFEGTLRLPDVSHAAAAVEAVRKDAAHELRRGMTAFFALILGGVGVTFAAISMMVPAHQRAAALAKGKNDDIAAKLFIIAVVTLAIAVVLGVHLVRTRRKARALQREIARLELA